MLKSQKLPARSSKMSNKRVVDSEKEFPSKQLSGKRECSFNKFPIKFRTISSEMLAQSFQQIFTLDNLMQF